MADEARIEGMLLYLPYDDAAAAMAWFERVLGFREKSRWLNEDGVVTNVEMMAGETEIWLDRRGPDYWKQKGRGPELWTGVWVDDVDAVHRRVRDAGVETPPPEDKFYGIRSFSVTDPDGYNWFISQRIPISEQPGMRFVAAK